VGIRLGKVHHWRISEVDLRMFSAPMEYIGVLDQGAIIESQHDQEEQSFESEAPSFML